MTAAIQALSILATASILLQVYHFMIYPVLVEVLSRWRRPSRPPMKPDASVSLIILAFNERGVIIEKLQNSIALAPPPQEIIIVADGSEDGTDELADRFHSTTARIRVLFDPVRRGKAAAMERGVEAANGEILLFSDANAIYAKGTVAAICRGFDRDEVAVVSGVKHIIKEEAADRDGVAASDGLYWRLEHALRVAETRLGCTVAVVGEVLAVRSSDWVPIPKDVVNDDAWIAMSAIARGYDVVCVPEAESWERASQTGAEEVARRRRINAGRLKMVLRNDIWPISRPWPLFAFVSHKILRLFLPVFFVVSLVGSLALCFLIGSATWILISALHLLFLLFGLLGATNSSFLGSWAGARLSAHILRSYWAVTLAFWDVAKGRDFILWDKIAR